jgi:hypothetical protein
VSRSTLPFQYGPLFSLGATYHLSRLDHLSVLTSLSQTWLFAEPQVPTWPAQKISATLVDAPTPLRPSQFISNSLTADMRLMQMSDLIVQSTASWRHVFSRATESTLSGGIGWARADHDGMVVTTGIYPVAEASLIHHVPSGRLDVRLDVRFSPMVDRWSGEVDERVDYMGSLQWNATRRLTLKANVGASQPVPPVHLDAPVYMIDSVSLAYQFNRFFQIEGGGRSMLSRWVHGDEQPPGTGFAGQQFFAPITWVSFMAVTVTAPGIKF